MLGLRTAVEIGHEQHVLLAKREQEIVVQAVERVGLHRLVDFAPPDGRFRYVVPDDELVLGGATGELARAHDERAILGQQSFAATHGMLDERRRGQRSEERRVGKECRSRWSPY